MCTNPSCPPPPWGLNLFGAVPTHPFGKSRLILTRAQILLCRAMISKCKGPNVTANFQNLHRALLSSPLQILTSTPLATKCFVGALLAFSIGNSYLQYTSMSPYEPIPYLTLLPGRSFLFPWTFLTAGFVEPHFVGVRCNSRSG